MNEREFQPYTQTHTMTLRLCHEQSELYAQQSEEVINQKFASLLLDAGWNVQKHSVNGSLLVMSHGFDGSGGFTATAILGTSDVTVHTYPEEEFRATAEFEFNLCYLQKKIEFDHGEALEKSLGLLRRQFRPQETHLTSSEKRYL